MEKLLILLFICLFGCSSISMSEPTTNWKKTSHLEIDGIVEIATGWGKASLCTGILIKQNVVLTAAHCVAFPKEDLFIVYGCDDIDHSHCKRISIKRIEKHPSWKSDFALTNDIAIIITQKPILIKIAEISRRKHLPKGLSVKAAGFGVREGGSGVLYSGRGRIHIDYKYEAVVCMTGKLDPNPGDSGGPLLFLESGKFKVGGILSRSRWSEVSKVRTFAHSGCAVYTKPVMYMNWIGRISKKWAKEKR